MAESKMVTFCHGALRETYEKQANNQGFTLGETGKDLEQLGFSVTLCHIHGLLTDSQYDSALMKLHKKLIKALRKI